MKTWSTKLIAGIILVLIQLLLVLFSGMGSGAVFTWARDPFWHTIVFCLPAIIGISLISSDPRWRKQIEDRMWDPDQDDPRDR